MLRCDMCVEPAVVIEPGSEEVRELFVLRRAVPLRCWCLRHWPAALARSEATTR